MIVGLLPAIRGGLGELAQTGQHSRLIDGYLVPYAQAFAEVRYFSYLDESLASFTADRTLLERVRVLPGGREHPWRYAFAMARRHGRAMRECSVFRVFQITGVVPALIARRRWGIPFVATYGFHYERLARSRSRALLRRVVARLGVRAAAAVIVPTAELADIVSAQGGAGKIHVVPNGVDTRRFRPAPGPPGGRAILLYVGRLSVEKDLATLLEAAGKLLARFDLAVAMVGEGNQRSALEARARALGVPLTLTPFVDHRELPRVYAGARVFVLPSLTEGHPKVLLEAMSCGVPCVASRVGGSRSILGDGDTGLLFEPGDAGGLAARIEQVLAQPDLSRRLGERARAEILERYDLTRLVAGEIELLRRVARA
ncbi:MAG TPA: glycosyltransferase family 4 protein [Methylomirabilota bacterium]|nr:glycosyltransferase family 4 protein [Methylomirabilota bacterium]